jgi:NAD(P)-dependent dehydrogenase (short-subunit alcohol dehydrogenase family)
MSSLAGRVILVTGGARGIGLAIAETAARRGAGVAIADIDASAAIGAAARLGEKCRGYHLDVTDRSEFEEVLSRAEEEIGPVDVLVNNAGIAEASPRVGEQPREMVDQIIDVNLNGVINGTLAALKRMEPRGGGQIVNVASQAGRNAVPALAAYTASKFGVVGFTDTARFEYRGTGICLTCVMPGPVDTGMMSGTRKVPLIRLVTPEDVARETVAAIETRREEVFVPRSTGYLVRFAGMLPPKARERIIRASGLHRVYRDIDPRIRSEYSSRVAPQITARERARSKGPDPSG